LLGTVRVGSQDDPIPPSTLIALRDLGGADEAEYFELRRSDRAVLGLATSDEVRAVAGTEEAMVAYGHQNPIGWRRWSPAHGALRLSSRIGPRALRRLEFYNEFMGPNRLRDILKVWLVSDATSVACVQLWRRDGDFSRSEQDLLGVLHRDLMQLRSSALGDVGRWATRDVALTAREGEVLVWAMRGYSHEEIAARLGSTAGTVGKHLEHAYAKLDVRSRAQAVDRLLLSGPIDSSPAAGARPTHDGTRARRHAVGRLALRHRARPGARSS
jgi:DNA-binding CsgD family transcriptional regulator